MFIASESLKSEGLTTSTSTESISFFPFFLKRSPFGLKKEVRGFLFLSKLGRFSEVKAVFSKFTVSRELGLESEEKLPSVLSVYVKELRTRKIKVDEKDLEEKAEKNGLLSLEELCFLRDFLGKVFEEGQFLVDAMVSVSCNEKVRVSLFRRVSGEGEGTFSLVKTKKFNLKKEQDVKLLLNFLKKHEWCQWKVFLEAGRVYLIEPPRCYECGGVASVEVKSREVSLSLCFSCYFSILKKVGTKLIK